MQISNAQSLREKLTAKTEQDRQETEKLTAQQLKKLSDNLTNLVKNELLSTGTVIKSETESISKTAKTLSWIIKKQWIASALIGLCLLLSISAGSWGLMQYLSWQIQSNLASIKEQNQALREQNQALEQIKAKTWGLNFTQDNSGKYIVLPQGMTLQSGFVVGKNPAYKLTR